MLVSLFSQLREHSSERLNNLSKVIHVVSGKTRVWIQVWFQSWFTFQQTLFARAEVESHKNKISWELALLFSKYLFPSSSQCEWSRHPHLIDIGLDHVIRFGQQNISGCDMSWGLKYGCMVWLGACPHTICHNKNISWVALVKGVWVHPQLIKPAVDL